jgi:hypothetical protein
VPAVSREGYAREVEEAFRTLREEGLLVAASPPDEMSQAKHLPLGSSFGMPLVVDQRPDAGRTVKTGSVVRLVGVPAGHTLLPRPPPESAVPELTGLTLREALRRIDAAGLYWWTMLPFLPPTDGPGFLDAYRVTSQDPSAGDLGSRVTLDVAPAR